MQKVCFLIAAALLFLFGPVASHALRLEAGQRIASRVAIAAQTAGPSIIPGGRVFEQSEDSTHPSKKRHSIFDLPRVEQWATQKGLEEHHLKTIYKVVMNSSPENSAENKAGDFATRLKQGDFPHKHADALVDEFHLTTSRIVEQQPSTSGGTKIVIELSTGQLIETVLIRHERTAAPANDSFGENVIRGSTSSSHSNHRKKEGATKTRYTVCVSSQVGCAKSCTFCATGMMGLLANLSSAEILEQVWLARSLLPRSHHSNNQLRNLVFMGMGEPLDNYDAVHEACRGLTHQCLFGFKAKQVTISTVGDAPHRIQQLADDAPQISLALSLHGATQSLRATLIPTARRTQLADLEAAMDYHARKGGRGIMLEYLLIDGLNDTEEAANALVEFCQRAEYATFVNLIPYNPTIAGAAFDYQTPSNDRIDAFHGHLRESGIHSLVRWSSAKGRDANGACGQLASAVRARKTTPWESRCTTA